MGILSWIVVGLIAGVVAKLLLPGRDPGGCIITMLIGIAGAILGGFLVGLFVGGNVVTGVNLTTVLVAVLGAIILLLLYRLLLGRRASAP
ncbi:MAG: GlsB/YeaQ/YmgE family stress response membrane protein [Chloroflexi bacterium]|nr:MAG: GlsB/YeaQ/YmgE family stress response membrane protein [Chloroflexota bacterium]